MQLYHPDNAKAIMDSLGHVPLNAKLPSPVAVGVERPNLPSSDPVGGHLKLPSDPVAVGDAG